MGVDPSNRPELGTDGIATETGAAPLESPATPSPRPATSTHRRTAFPNLWLLIPVIGILALGGLSQWGGPATVLRAAVVVVGITLLAAAWVTFLGLRRATAIMVSLVVVAVGLTVLTFPSVTVHLRANAHRTSHQATAQQSRPGSPTTASGTAAKTGISTVPLAAGARFTTEDLAGRDLRRADFAGARLDGVDVRGRVMNGAIFAGATMRGANLVDASLSGADLIGADLSGANLSGACLRGVQLNNANLAGIDISGADIHGAQLPPGFNTGQHHVLASDQPAALSCRN